jgi:hypothetical protein
MKTGYAHANSIGREEDLTGELMVAIYHNFFLVVFS